VALVTKRAANSTTFRPRAGTEAIQTLCVASGARPLTEPITAIVRTTYLAVAVGDTGDTLTLITGLIRTATRTIAGLMGTSTGPGNTFLPGAGTDALAEATTGVRLSAVLPCTDRRATSAPGTDLILEAALSAAGLVGTLALPGVRTGLLVGAGAT